MRTGGRGERKRKGWEQGGGAEQEKGRARGGELREGTIEGGGEGTIKKREMGKRDKGGGLKA